MQKENKPQILTIDGKFYRLVPIEQYEVLALLNGKNVSVKTEANATTKKPRKQTNYKHTCAVCNTGTSSILNMFGSCDCTIHQRCSKEVNKLTGKSTYTKRCPVCYVMYTPGTLKIIQDSVEKMKKVSQQKQNNGQGKQEKRLKQKFETEDIIKNYQSGISHRSAYGAEVAQHRAAGEDSEAKYRSAYGVNAPSARSRNSSLGSLEKEIEKITP